MFCGAQHEQNPGESAVIYHNSRAVQGSQINAAVTSSLTEKHMRPRCA